MSKPNNNSIKKIKGKFGGNEALAKESLGLFRAIIDGAVSHGKIKEEEETKRIEIESDLIRDLEKIRAQRDILESYLRHTFDERKTVIDNIFSRLDIALADNRDAIVIQALSSIEGIIKSNPLEGLLVTRKAFESQGGLLEI